MLGYRDCLRAHYHSPAAVHRAGVDDGRESVGCQALSATSRASAEPVPSGPGCGYDGKIVFGAVGLATGMQRDRRLIDFGLIGHPLNGTPYGTALDLCIVIAAAAAMAVARTIR